MNQAHLFENPVSAGIDRAMHASIAATADPSTSHEAAREITESGKREGQLQGVLALVKRYPLSTSLELARHGYDRYVIARRLPELESGRLVTKRSPRTCTVSGHRAVTWEALMLLAFALIFLPSLRAQVIAPYVMGGGAVSTGLGYHPIGVVGGAGAVINLPWLTSTDEVIADSSHKIDASSGYSVRLRSDAYFKVSKLWLGGGVTYTKLVTDLYSKSAIRPRAGVTFKTAAMRFTGEYVFANDYQNNLSGTEFTFILPEKGRVFFREDFGLYLFHATFRPDIREHGIEERMMLGVRF